MHLHLTSTWCSCCHQLSPSKSPLAAPWPGWRVKPWFGAIKEAPGLGFRCFASLRSQATFREWRAGKSAVVQNWARPSSGGFSRLLGLSWAELSPVIRQPGNMHMGSRGEDLCTVQASSSTPGTKGRIPARLAFICIHFFIEREEGIEKWKHQ